MWFRAHGKQSSRMLTLVEAGGVKVVQCINVFQHRALPPWPHGQVFRVTCLAETKILTRSLDAVLILRCQYSPSISGLEPSMVAVSPPEPLHFVFTERSLICSR